MLKPRLVALVLRLPVHLLRSKGLFGLPRFIAQQFSLLIYHGPESRIYSLHLESQAHTLAIIQF